MTRLCLTSYQCGFNVINRNEKQPYLLRFSKEFTARLLKFARELLDLSQAKVYLTFGEVVND